MTTDLDRERADAPEPHNDDRAVDPPETADEGESVAAEAPSTTRRTKTTGSKAPTTRTATKAASKPAAANATAKTGTPKTTAKTTAKATATKASTTKAAATRAPAAGTGGKRSPILADRSLAGLRTSRRLPWVLALLGLIGTIAFAVAWQGADREPGAAPTASAEGESAAMADGATSFSTALTNFDGATIDRDFDRIVARSTGEFRGQADEFFSSEVRKQLKEAQASSRGEVRSAYVQSFDGDRGSVFVVLDQTIANNKSPKPKADTLRMELTMARSDGRWLVQRVNVLTAPSGEDTIGAAAEATPTTVAGAGG